MARTAVPVQQRILTKFTVGDGCWEWSGSRNKGYGVINSGGRFGRPLQAHVVLYEMLAGPVPEGLYLDHLCRNRGCVRPDHLEPVTHAENVRRGEAGEVHRERMALLTHCKNGHEFTPQNTHIGKNANGNDRRVCRACRASREANRRRRLANVG